MIEEKQKGGFMGRFHFDAHRFNESTKYIRMEDLAK
jgi:hypothetical protein